MILEWELDGQRHNHWLSPGTTATIGRGADCAVTLAHPTVSRRHGEIFAQGSSFYIRNLSPTNPIILEHYGGTTRVGHGQQVAVPTGGRLLLGEVRVQLREAVALRVRCPGPCGKVVAVPASGFCPNCGIALATADTFTG